MITITLLAFASMAASLFITNTTEGLATAINESGTLRMSSYRIANELIHNTVDNREHWIKTHQLITEFEKHLSNFNLNSVRPNEKHHHLHTGYAQTEKQWVEEIRPLFDTYLDGIMDIQTAGNAGMDMSISEAAVTNLRNRYFMIAPDFVANIDNLVALLEQDAKIKIKRLRNFQFIVLILTIILVLIALVLIYSRIQKPLKQLLTGAEKARNGDFSFRSTYTGKDELGQLGSAFNSMAEDLSKIYTELEERVQQKTIDLEQSNLSLELLYKTVNRLNEAESLNTTYPIILEDIEKLPGIGKGAICLNNNKKENATMLASTLPIDDLVTQLCEETNCRQCLTGKKNHLINITDNNKNKKQLLTIPIQDQTQQYGVLIIEQTNNKPVTPWQQQLLENITNHIGIAIKLSQQSAETRRLALIEERGAIARELHDSLAQSLTFMKIQVSRLQAISEKSSNNPEEINIISELRIGLNSAYRELRELLTTFRLKIDGNDFNDTLHKTVLEFNDRSETNISCDSKITYFDLSPNEEIHILQLIREALSNIIQHAHASRAFLLIQYNSVGDIQIIIEDNGIGIDKEQSKTHHYGLSIMKERAKTLDGTFEIINNQDTGTEVKLTFTPINKATPVQINE
ncbi:MAG: HAMP domain-containing protein [Gammaproteobacteria bacterium]|nr:HAMP domain-containing protein [Gammaproteobacteria bacterium]